MCPRCQETGEITWCISHTRVSSIINQCSPMHKLRLSNVTRWSELNHFNPNHKNNWWHKHTKRQPFFHSAMTLWHKDSAVRNCLLTVHCCFLSFSTRLGADMNRPPHENGFQDKSMGCTGKTVVHQMQLCSDIRVLQLWLMWKDCNDRGSRNEDTITTYTWKDLPWRKIQKINAFESSWKHTR